MFSHPHHYFTVFRGVLGTLAMALRGNCRTGVSLPFAHLLGPVWPWAKDLLPLRAHFLICRAQHNNNIHLSFLWNLRRLLAQSLMY